MAPMGYDIKIGYAVGITLELAKEVLPVAVLALWTRRARSGVGDWRRLALRCGLQLLGNARHCRHGHLVDRTEGHLENGGADKCENRAGVGRAAAGGSEPASSAPADENGPGGTGCYQRAACHLEGQSRVCRDPGQLVFCEGLRPSCPAASRACSI